LYARVARFGLLYCWRQHAVAFYSRLCCCRCCRLLRICCIASCLGCDCWESQAILLSGL
jgi:hypothetical protein